MRAQRTLHVARPYTEGQPRADEAQHPLHRWFLPSKESRSMSDEAQRTNGLFLPWPLLGLIMTLVLSLGGGLVGLYTQLSAMQTTLLLRDADAQRQIKDLKDKQDQMEIYLHNDRETIATMKAQIERNSRRN